MFYDTAILIIIEIIYLFDTAYEKAKNEMR